MGKNNKGAIEKLINDNSLIKHEKINQKNKNEFLKRERAKKLLIEKHGISEVEAEKVLKKIENNSKYKNKSKKSNNQSNNVSNQKKTESQQILVQKQNDGGKLGVKSSFKKSVNQGDDLDGAGSKQVSNLKNIRSDSNLKRAVSLDNHKIDDAKSSVEMSDGSYAGDMQKKSNENESSDKDNDYSLGSYKNNVNEDIDEESIKEVYSQSSSTDEKTVNKDKEYKLTEDAEKLESYKDSQISENNGQKKDVDSILSNIIPDYNKFISVEVKHVDLTFDIERDRVDTLKESFIRTVKGDKEDKIKLHALKDISFKIYKGEKVAIIGYNGAGKSTLLKVICGIYPVDNGSVETNGNISPLLSLGAGFDYNYSGRKNIFLNGAVLGYDKKFLESKVDEIIEFSELGEFIDFPIKNYSSGMLSKLGFSIATILEPDILIIDEILGVGDVNFSKKSVDKIKSLMDGGTTVLFVSHSIPQVREICDKAIWIDNGEIREIGEVNKVCDHYLKDAEKASNEQLANIQFR